MDLRNQIVVLTGAGGGIGAAMIDALAAAGARLVLCDRPEGLDALGEVPAAIHRESFDLVAPAACRRAAETIIAAVGLPDVVISNAGWTRAETLETTDAEAWEFELAVNLSGTRHFTDAFLPGMRAAAKGCFVFVSSVNALAHYGNPAYAAAKAGLLAYMRALAVEGGPHGIRANAVCPGSVRTAAWDHRFAAKPDLGPRIAALYPMRRMVRPEEVAAAALFLASPAASGITGATLPVDGGLSAGNPPFIDAIA